MSGGKCQALVQHHGDIGTQTSLDIGRTLRRQELTGAVEMGAEVGTLFGDHPSVGKAEDLIPAAVGQDRPPPSDELMQPTASRGPILLQEVSTNTVDQSSVAGIATLTSFGALVPASTTDFPADFIRLPGDAQRVYQITSAGAVSRYTTGGVNTVLTPIPAATGSTWSDTATDPTGNVYGSAVGATAADRDADMSLRAAADDLHTGRADPE